MKNARPGSIPKPVKIIDIEFDSTTDLDKNPLFYDPEEKSIIYYWSDGKQVYWRYNPISKDVKNFQVFNDRFAKDSTHCFLQSIKLRWAEHDSFAALNYCYAFDGKSAQTTAGRFEPADPQTFTVCDDGFWLSTNKITLTDGRCCEEQKHIPYGYAKDSKQVYYENYAGKIKILKKADPVTFVSNNDGYYGWDQNNVFYGKNTLPGANPATWKLLDGFYHVSTDGKHFYIQNHKVSEEEALSKMKTLSKKDCD